MILATNGGAGAGAHARASADLVIDDAAGPAVRYAAEELRRYIHRITGVFARLRQVRDGSDVTAGQILVGDSAHRALLFPDVDPDELGSEAYVMRTREGRMLLIGGSDRATLYAAYDLLERLGVRWWTPSEQTVPTRACLEVDALDITVDPPLVYRAIWYRHAMDADWLARMRLNGGTMSPVLLTERHGGMERFAADRTSHTYASLVPAAEFFAEHPEYFSEVDGRRLQHTTQLCCTHPKVIEIAADRAAQWLRATPGCRLVSVTQNDHGNWCTCARCARLIEREESTSAPALYLANQVARSLAKEFPDVMVDTFAYTFTEKVPKRMKAHPNVLVRFAPIRNCFGHPIRTCVANRQCRDNMRAWADVARQLFVWHYVTDFFHYLTPFPNLPSLVDDLDFYRAHGVTGMFLQGDGTSLGGDMAELKAYLMARLIWNPDLDAAVVRAEFLDGYYGAAGPAVADAVSAFEESFQKARPREHLFLYRTLWQNTASYLTPSTLARARDVLKGGRRAARDDPTVLARLDRIDMGLDYTDLFYHARPGRRQLSRGTCVCPVSRRRARLIDRLFRTVTQEGVSHYGEDLGRYTTTSSLRRIWQDSIGSHPSLTLRAGGHRAVIVPDLGGRLVAYGHTAAGDNLLGVGSPQTFGYPCCGGYEEYSLSVHQSPGFSESFAVVRRDRSSVRLAADLETGLRIRRDVRLNGKVGDVVVASQLRNDTDTTLGGCLRAHLEIDLGTKSKSVEVWLLIGRTWARHDSVSGAWYDNEVPAAWAFWSPSRGVGIRQTWRREDVGAAHLGSVASEPTVLTLDLAVGRANRAIEAGGRQALTHRFRKVTSPPRRSGA